MSDFHFPTTFTSKAAYAYYYLFRQRVRFDITLEEEKLRRELRGYFLEKGAEEATIVVLENLIKAQVNNTMDAENCKENIRNKLARIVSDLSLQKLQEFVEAGNKEKDFKEEPLNTEELADRMLYWEDKYSKK